MANRIVDNVYILDTATSNGSLSWPTRARIQAINFIGTELRMSGASTTNILVAITGNSFQYYGGVDFGADMKIPAITAGTAWVYFS